MNLDRKLGQWVDAGVIDDATRLRIQGFEQGQRKPIALYALAVLGGGTVALGLISIVASNWDAIAPGVKLGGDLLLGAALGGGVLLANDRGRRLATEVLVTLYYGYCLASLALVGQIYQLGTPTYQGLVVWSAATLPLLLIGRSRYLAALGCAGLFITHGSALEALFEALERVRGESFAINTVACALFASPLAYVLLARVPWLVRERSEYARTLGALAWTGVLVGAVGLQLIWYETTDRDDTLSWALAVTAALAGGVCAALPRLYPELPSPVLRGLQVILGAVWLTLAIGFGLPHDDFGAVGAVLQLLCLGLFARVCLQLGRLRAFNVLTALFAVRVIVAYFEVFGSLLDTGLGLISGGALTLLAAWVWRRRNQGAARALSERPERGHVA